MTTLLLKIILQVNNISYIICRSWSKVTTTLSSSLQEMDEIDVRTAPKQGERLTEAEVAETGSVS